MERDPDYIDPEVLKRRAAASGGAGARSSRPRVRRVADDSTGESGFRVARDLSSVVVSGSSIVRSGIKLAHSRELKIS